MAKETQQQSQEMEYIEALSQELEAVRQAQANSYQGQTAYSMPQKQNLVEWQLDFKTELEDIEHLLRNDILVRDTKGNTYWGTNPSPDEIIFNNKGVTEILLRIRMFLNKNMVLSNYKDTEIKIRMHQFGNAIRELIYNNMEEYGLTTEYKIMLYPITVITIVAMVESAYKRSMNGEERRDLNSARVVQQNENTMPMQQGNYPKQKATGLSKILPWNW